MFIPSSSPPPPPPRPPTYENLTNGGYNIRVIWWKRSYSDDTTRHTADITTVTAEGRVVRAQNGNSRRLRAYSVFATSAGALLGPSYAPGLLALQCFPTVEYRFKALHLSGGGDRAVDVGWAGLVYPTTKWYEQLTARPTRAWSTQNGTRTASWAYVLSQKLLLVRISLKFPNTPPKNTLFLYSKNQISINLHE